MKRYLKVSSVFLIIGFVLVSCQGKLIVLNKVDSKLTGPYFGLKPPGGTPELFAVGTISTRYHEHSYPAFSKDLKEVYWNTMLEGNTFKYPTRILTMKEKEGQWSKPEYAEFSLLPGSGTPCFSPDGKRLYFSSNWSENGKKGDGNIWYVKKTEKGWSKPIKLNSNVNTQKNESQPTVAGNLNLYFMGYWEGRKWKSGIYRSEYKNGEYQKPQILPVEINSNTIEWTPFIAPDESYLLFCSYREGGSGSGDIYISFRIGDNQWSKAVNLGPQVNSKYNDRFPGISPDGKYLFFLSDKVNPLLKEKKKFGYEELKDLYNRPGNGYCDIYWVDAKVIEDIRLNNSK